MPYMKLVLKMDRLINFFVLTVSSVCVIQGAYDPFQETCVLSLVVPRDRIKNSCSETERKSQKFLSLDSQLRQTMRDVNDLKLRWTVSRSRANSESSIQNMAQQIQELQTKVLDLESRCTNLENKGQGYATQQDQGQTETETYSPEDYADILRKEEFSGLIQSLIDKETEKIKDQVITELLGSEFLIRDISRFPKPTSATPEDILQTTEEMVLQTATPTQPTGQRSTPVKGHKTTTTVGESSTTEATLTPDTSTMTPTSTEDSYIWDSQPRKRAAPVYHLSHIPNKDGSKVGHNYHSHRSRHNFAEDHSSQQEKGHQSHQHEQPQSANGHKNTSGISHDQINDLIKWLRAEIMLSIDAKAEKFNTVEKKKWEKIHLQVLQAFANIQNVKDESTREIRLLKSNQNTKIAETDLRLSDLERDMTNLALGVGDMRDNILNDPEFRNLLKEHENNFESKVISNVSRILLPIKEDLTQLDRGYRSFYNYQQVLIKTLQSHRNETKFRFDAIKHNLTSIYTTMQEINSSIPLEEVDYTTYDPVIDLELTKNKVKDLEQLVVSIQNNVTSLEWTHNQDKYVFLSNLTDVISNFSEIRSQKTQLNQKVKNLTRKIQTMRKNIKDLRKKQHALSLSVKLTTTEWTPYNFTYHGRQTACFGQQFIKKTGYEVGKFVGIVLCSRTRYKIFLSDSLDEEFKDVGDGGGKGEDHCEFIGAKSENTVTVGLPKQHTVLTGYRRRSWGEEPKKELFRTFVNRSPLWYECGVTIP